ncbi:nuclear transport factor 2 family protein [Natronolimnobius sp. AArcel1]|uniref:nuclear transport factor 2 family protein n=1 Tax=Natronolimnobius sp. AArcel1 TaxID=1679093 RepID=UPI0013EAF341|nr:nuclear transport factor 2 family protein [Natronolimnobius sp. AArcel1]NGM68157.1 nuclear transport factor 2 family protein [Natronolimnobius sp. AArcel1]
MDAAGLVRQYYDALDGHEYEALESILAPAFVQHRPDRTFEDRASFIAFMRTERPNPNTRHELDAVVADADTELVAARGTVVDAETNEMLFEFADFFSITDGQIVRLETYSR